MFDNKTIMMNSTEITDVRVLAADFVMYKIGKLV